MYTQRFWWGKDAKEAIISSHGTWLGNSAFNGPAGVSQGKTHASVLSAAHRHAHFAMHARCCKLRQTEADEELIQAQHNRFAVRYTEQQRPEKKTFCNIKTQPLQRRCTLMVQSVDPEKRRRSSNMARHTTAPWCPVSRCSSKVGSTPLPSSPPTPAATPLAPVQLDSSRSTRLPAHAEPLHTSLCTTFLYPNQPQLASSYCVLSINRANL